MIGWYEFLMIAGLLHEFQRFLLIKHEPVS
jgi:hypothetical protein